MAYNEHTHRESEGLQKAGIRTCFSDQEVQGTNDSTAVQLEEREREREKARAIQNVYIIVTIVVQLL